MGITGGILYVAESRRATVLAKAGTPKGDIPT